MHQFWNKVLSVLFSVLLVSIVPINTACSLKPDLINIDGSSSMYALFQSFSNRYKKSDLLVSANGSAAGINLTLNGNVDFGNVSEDTSEYTTSKKKFQNTNKTYQDLWQTRRIKTIKLGYDPILVIYKKAKGNEKLYLASNNVDKFYKLFAGFDKFSYYDFGGNSRDPIYAFNRIGGMISSGTAAAFAKNNELMVWKEHPDMKNIYSALETGNYGNRGHVVTTSESNVQVWTEMVNSDKKSIMGYLSAGFVYTNWKIINKDFDILGYKPINSSTIIYPSKYINKTGDLINDGYGWKRLLNTIFSLSYSDSSCDNWTEREKNLLTFAYFLATGKVLSSFNPEKSTNCSWYKRALEKCGVAPLSDKDNEWKSMFHETKINFVNFLYSDCELNPKQA